MKVVLYNDAKIINIIENCKNVKVDGDYITWEDGGLQNVKVKFAVVSDDSVIENVDDLQYEGLEEAKKIKKEELSKACRDKILTGFSSSTTGNSYKFDEEDQLNFVHRMVMLLADPSVSKVDWKTKDKGVVSHNRQDFMKIVSEADSHKSSNIQKYRDLENQINNATTVDEVNSIKW